MAGLKSRADASQNLILPDAYAENFFEKFFIKNFSKFLFFYFWRFWPPGRQGDQKGFSEENYRLHYGFLEGFLAFCHFLAKNGHF